MNEDPNQDGESTNISTDFHRITSELDKDESDYNEESSRD